MALDACGAAARSACFRAGRRLPFRRHAGILLQVLDAAEHLHTVAGLAHTDLKLENVVRVSPAGDDVQVIDFGMAARITDAARGTIAARPWLCALIPPFCPLVAFCCVAKHAWPFLHACARQAQVGHALLDAVLRTLSQGF